MESWDIELLKEKLNDREHCLRRVLEDLEEDDPCLAEIRERIREELRDAD